MMAAAVVDPPAPLPEAIRSDPVGAVVPFDWTICPSP
jgi:hypothetical protein